MAHDSMNPPSLLLLLLLVGVIVSVSVFVFALTSSWTSTPNSNNKKAVGSRAFQTLKLAVVVSRHGNRGTLSIIPNDPYPINSTQFWPYGAGGLTPHGRVQMYNLGAKIRSLYDGFLDSKYDSKDFYASSTAIDRTIISGEAFLAGLYPPTSRQPWEEKFPSQLIPLYSNSPDKTLEAEYCGKVLRIRNTTMSGFGEENAAVISGLNKYLSKYLEMNVTGVSGFFSTWDSVFCESTEGFILPSWMQQIFPQPLMDLAGKYYIAFVAGTDNLVRLIMGNFYKEVLGIMKSKVEGTLSPDRKMYFYSGHDFTLITLQAILGIPKSSIIGVANPGSAMIFELHQDPKTKEFSVQVIYMDGSSEDLALRHLPIPGCSSSCSFQQLVYPTQRFTNIGNFDKECQL